MTNEAVSRVYFPRLRSAIFCVAALLALSEACYFYLFKTVRAEHIIPAATFVALISAVQAQ